MPLLVLLLRVISQHLTKWRVVATFLRLESQFPAYPGNQVVNICLKGEVGPIDWLVGFFFIIEEGCLRSMEEVRPTPSPSVFFGEKAPFLGGRGLPVSLLKWGDRRGGAGTGLMEQCSLNFTWKKWTFAWVGGSYRLTSASSCLWLFLAAWKTCLDSHGHGYVTKSGHSRMSSKSRQFPT